MKSAQCGDCVGTVCEVVRPWSSGQKNKKKYVLPIPDLKLTAAGGPSGPSPPPEGVGEGPEGPLFVFKPATTAVSPLFVPVN
jgi:hypothetical protein